LQAEKLFTALGKAPVVFLAQSEGLGILLQMNRKAEGLTVGRQDIPSLNCRAFSPLYIR
jgi:dsDNA-binding SOS-regulon protein